jgi:ABC-type transport system involved in cytochrome c biogenesis permease subunit
LSLLDFSQKSLMAALLIYSASFILYMIAVGGKKWSHGEPEAHSRKWGWIAFGFAAAGWAAHVTFFVTRWIAGGHIPTSNMYEFMTMLAMAVMLAFIIIYLIYRNALLGAFTLPLTVVIIAYASVFPSDIQPLIPSLNSTWLRVHVTTAALGEAFFAVGFAAALVQLLRVIDYSRTDKAAMRARRWMEAFLFIILVVVGFLLSVFAFRAAGYHAEFKQVITEEDDLGQQHTTERQVVYGLPPVVKPYSSEAVSVDSFLGMQEPLFAAPPWMNGVNAGRKLNTILWSIATGAILYGLLRLIARKQLGAVLRPHLSDIDPDDLDEISYRSIAIGYPIFTLGGLIFAMIWAQIAWSRFWGWDPKEVWALITWLFYTAYLHLRLSRGWHGAKSAWLAVVGFLVVLFTLIGVNLVIAGLHSYAGVS